MIEFIDKYWEYILILTLVADKVVAITPCKWDDMILTAIKLGFKSIYKPKKQPDDLFNLKIILRILQSLRVHYPSDDESPVPYW